MREDLPTRREAAWLELRIWAHRGLRTLENAIVGVGPGALQPAGGHPGVVLSEQRSTLWTAEAASEFELIAGKVENLRVAARALHGRVLAPGQLFSFWAHLGRPSKRAGYVLGREARHGCVVPAVAGGICQLTSALHSAAMEAGCEIVERHAHRHTAARIGDGDATVLWNYLDLRFVPRQAVRLEVELTATQLVVRLRGERQMRVTPTHRPLRLLTTTPRTLRSCHSCGQDDCSVRRAPPVLTRPGTAWLLDGVTPELDSYVSQHRNPLDTILLPLDPRRLRRPRYDWSVGTASVRDFPVTVAKRSWASRRLSDQGATRQHALLGFETQLAQAMAQAIPVHARHLVVAQHLLPHLWTAGVLGGRTFDVLATRPPLHELHGTLDRAASLHTESQTLADYRAPRWLADAERDALAQARRVISAHPSALASFGARGHQLPWSPVANLVAPPERNDAPTLLWHPAPLAGRKGCYALAQAIEGLDVELCLNPGNLEGRAVFNDHVVHRSRLPPRRPALAVLPAWVHAAPRALLQARAWGVPIIASPEVGLRGDDVALVPPADVAALRSAIEQHLSRKTCRASSKTGRSASDPRF